jgi:hypothetical protein
MTDETLEEFEEFEKDDWPENRKVDNTLWDEAWDDTDEVRPVIRRTTDGFPPQPSSSRRRQGTCRPLPILCPFVSTVPILLTSFLLAGG